MAKMTNRSPTDLARAITQATPKPAAKRQTLTQRCNGIESIQRDQADAVDRANTRIETLAEIQGRTLAEVQLLKLQQTDHADRLQLEALQNRLYRLEQATATAHDWLKTRIANQSTGTTIVASVMISTLITILIVAIVSSPKPQTRPIQPQTNRHDLPTIAARATARNPTNPR